MKVRFNIILILLLIQLTACYDYNRNYFVIATVPVTPANFELVNSEYDDYNSSMEYNQASKVFTLVFSTNRFSEGTNFDFIYYQCMATFSYQYGEFAFYMNDYPDEQITEMLDSINSAGNELGPCFLNDYRELSGKSNYPAYNDTARFFYASDKSGTLDIYYRNVPLYGESLDIDREISGLNSNFDEAYPTMHYHLLPSIYFTSNREGDFDIYQASSFDNRLITETDSVVINKVEKLCSTKDDKCPYIVGNLLIFASDREGGYGGFDLWYSVFNGKDWSGPANFGKTINTEYDEYRPVIISLTEDWEFRNDLMIFSSNRPGGKGGFDLYYVGTDVLKTNRWHY
jgi:hypothetical protein